MQRMGIHFNHEEEYRWTWYYYAVASVFGIFIPAMVHVWQNIYKSNDSPLLEVLREFAIYILQVASSLIIPTSFTIILYNIHRRFILLNFFLRLQQKSV